MNRDWNINSWRNFKISQQPIWTNESILNSVLNDLKKLPSLVFSEETRSLKSQLVDAEIGDKFILQAGNCAESFSDCHGPEIHNFQRIIRTMSEILELASEKPIIKIGRIAGQYGKPRSNDFEYINGINLPVYRGDNVNRAETTLESRSADAERLKEGYFRSAATLNLLRAFTQGNYGDLTFRDDWHEFPYSKGILDSDLFNRFKIGLSKGESKIGPKSLYDNQIYTSHEALLLDYEECFTRIDTIRGGFYNTSAHFLWLGDRTRDLMSAHVEYLRGIGNPIGIKVGPSFNADEIVSLVKILNPSNEKGKIVLIVRLGVDNIEKLFKKLIISIQHSKLNISWMVDPMHGNTKQVDGKKVRYFKDILNEIKHFFTICKVMDVTASGLHLEMTSKLVTECIGGDFGVLQSEIGVNYESLVDPRLNGAQSIELILEISEFLKK